MTVVHFFNQEDRRLFRFKHESGTIAYVVSIGHAGGSPS